MKDIRCDMCHEPMQPEPDGVTIPTKIKRGEREEWLTIKLTITRKPQWIDDICKKCLMHLMLGIPSRNWK